jgi:hypothetical protein
VLRREHHDARCQICYGTGFSNGFEQFLNPRRPDSRILIRVEPATEDLKIEDRGGLTPDYLPNCWTMAFPGLKDRDVLVRFNEDNTEEFRYEILNVQRVRAFFGQSGVQKFAMQRFARTDIIYQFPVTRSTSPFPETLAMSIESGPGIPAHTHALVVPHGRSLTVFNGSTSINERHHHVVRKGQIITVLGHTHTLVT